MPPRRQPPHGGTFQNPWAEPTILAAQHVFEDVSSPYFLHNSQNPGSILVTTLLSGAANYHSWSRAMLIALDTKNKTTFVDGTLPRPFEDDLLFNSWKRYNSMVKSWLLNSISQEFSTSLRCFQDASDIWTDLRSCFLESDGARIFDIKKNLATLNQGSMDVNSYYTKMKVLWDELDG